MTVYVLIFGAAVRPDGSPSGSLARRVAGALALARELPDCTFLATGGVGRQGPAEAEVMRELLCAAGIGRDEILVEPQAADTLQSVLLCHAILRRRADVDLLVACSSGYHVPRCALLLRMLGYRVRRAPAPSDRPHVGTLRWTRYVLKECAALPWDAALLLLHLAAGRLRRQRAE